jgi:bifunctional non-homologous end joining protein LigD
MGLKEYKEKRHFEDTPEPAGKVTKTVRGKLKFVIQKHNASRLHYDFRLEMEGVLKSWAVPKGPSVNPEDKRLAMMVEDHPMSYREFEGIIPEGNYGAGEVIVWDQGTYHPLDEDLKTKKKQEEALLEQLGKGSLKFVLEGEKLKGAFALFRFKNAGENSWLLVKEKDKFASDKDITKKNKSVISKRTIEQVAKSKKERVWLSNR